MGKNAHPPRGPKPPKKGNGEPAPGPDASSKDATDKKKGKAPPAAGTDAPATEPEVKKKPDTRTLIGGASWTGKLPVNLLSEHCQKQRWEKPEYTMSKTPDGFSSMVILKSKNPKTQELSTLPPFKLPPSHKHLAFQPTAVEARHFAAAYALFRVCSMKNIHLTMPPTYRDLWKGDFLDLKKEDVSNDRAWMYEADPFLAQREREEAQKQKQKERDLREQQKEEKKNVPGGAAPGASKGASMKGWTTAAKVEMGTKTRREVERIAKTYSIWNPQQIKISPQKRAEIIPELSSLGFRPSHVEEAVEVCKDREEILEWLLVHVPEDDLPAWCLPEGYVAGISLASGDLKRDAVVKRLSAGGFATELCQSLYDRFEGDEVLAAQALQDSLMEERVSLNDLKLNEPSGDWDNATGTWDEEQDVVSSIFGSKYELIKQGACRIQLEVSGLEQTAYCCIRRPPDGRYPQIPPIITIEAALPAHIRLSITRLALEHVFENLLGDQMIFNIVDWLEHEIPGIIANPGPLAKVASAASSLSSNSRGEPAIAGRNKRKRHPARLNWQPGTETSNKLFADLESRQKSSSQQKMLRVRQSLPAWRLQEAIVNAVATHQVVIISGETGSGKSTQSVQFILDDMIRQGLGEAANIICTQPRRISALGLADRVSDERCSSVGQEIGYAIRGESKQTTGQTKITFVTTGVLLRRLQTSGGSTSDVVASLADVSHVVVDEVHERSLDTDFLLALLRDVLRERKDLKVILMSATLDANIFERYFGGPRVVAKVEIQGRTFPVEDFYLDDAIRITQAADVGYGPEDLDGDTMGSKLQRLGMGINYDLIGSLVQRIDQDLGAEPGGILVFLPGTMEINKALDRLRNNSKFHALPLHASLLPSEQRKVFPPAPHGKRKVIFSTNVAETSITIEDVVAVIDSGRVKETRYDAQASMVKLEEVWASRAAGKQRRGRAGRVRAGMCYKLFTRNVESKMMDRPDPEIRRVPLEQLCLSVKAMGVPDVPQFLANTISPPEGIAVEGALALLQRIGAIDGGHLTSLGRHMSMIPADLRCAKLMVYGALFGYLEECVTIASILSVKSPFVSPQEKREDSKAVRTSFAQNQGDVIADMTAYTEWSEMRFRTSSREVRTWCDQNFLSSATLNDISSTRSQYLTSLKEIGFIPLDYKSRPTSPQQISYPFLSSLVLSSLHPQILRITLPAQRYQSTVSGALPVDPESREIKFFDAENARVFIHPSSTVFSAQSFPNNASFLSYFQKVETSKVFVRELTPCGSYGLLMFGGPIELDTQGRGLLVDGWARLRGWTRIGVLVSRLRDVLDRVLEAKIDAPGAVGVQGGMEKSLVEIVKKLVELEGMDR